MIGVWFEKEGVLVDEHAHGDAGHVEPVEEVLDGHVRLVVHLVRLLQLEDSLRDNLKEECGIESESNVNLSHCLHHIGVSGLHSLECLTKMQQGFAARVALLVRYHISEALTVPVLKL